MKKLNDISSTTVLVYITLLIVVSVVELASIAKYQSIYITSRIFCFLIGLLSYYFFKKNKYLQAAQILIATSLFFYNVFGYYFRPYYLPSIIHSLNALAFFIFMSRRLFVFVSTTITVLFTSFTIYIQPYIQYNNGETIPSDLILVSLTGLIISNLIHYFYTSERQLNELAQIQFGTLGRISAQAIHDLKGSFSSPTLLTDEIKLAIENKKYDDLDYLVSDLNNHITNLRSHILNLNQISQISDISESSFYISDCVQDVQNILKFRMKKITINLHDDQLIVTSRKLITSILINLLTNSLDEIEARKLSNHNISISFKNNILIYRDHLKILDSHILVQMKKDLFTSKSLGSGLGLYFIKDALSTLGGHLEIEQQNQEIVFKISLVKRNFKKYFY